MNFLWETLKLGLANLMLHKLRSLLTALGIIFGVSAVITMVAIGEGNKRKALADIRQLGANNIIVRSVKPADTPAPAGSSSRMSLSYGITRSDETKLHHLSTYAPIRRIVPLKRAGGNVTHGPHRVPAETFGTLPDLLEVTSLRVARGRYLTAADVERLDNVAVLGADVAERLFPLDDPIAGMIRIGDQSFTVVGVLQRVGLAGGAGTALVGRDLNFDVHIPITTATARFGDTIVRRQAGSMEATVVELSELYIEVDGEQHVLDVADRVKLIVDQAHGRTGDVTTIVPLELLEQQSRTLAMFNYLMTAIAAISLLVGGIGIMNIMLASVTERTREIGIRRALGATRRHVIAQFLTETTLLSSLGGLIGVALGPLAAFAIFQFMSHSAGGASAIGKPAVTLWSVVLSFVVATGVGIVFGLYPAVRASQQDPIVALRHD
jgi:putative ABC transport system permease protein